MQKFGMHFAIILHEQTLCTHSFTLTTHSFTLTDSHTLWHSHTHSLTLQHNHTYFHTLPHDLTHRHTTHTSTQSHTRSSLTFTLISHNIIKMRSAEGQTVKIITLGDSLSAKKSEQSDPSFSNNENVYREAHFLGPLSTISLRFQQLRIPNSRHIVFPFLPLYKFINFTFFWYLEHISNDIRLLRSRA